MIVAGLITFATGYLIQFNNIPYAPGDYRATPEYGSAILAISALAGVFLVVVGSIRRLQRMHERRHRP